MHMNTCARAHTHTHTHTYTHPTHHTHYTPAHSTKYHRGHDCVPWSWMCEAVLRLHHNSTLGHQALRTTYWLFPSTNLDLPLPLHSLLSPATKQSKREDKDRMTPFMSISRDLQSSIQHQEETESKSTTDATILTFRDNDHRYVGIAETGISRGETFTFSPAQEEADAEGVWVGR